MSDRIGVMDEGKLLQVGTSEEIYESPATRFVADFIGETNFIGGVVTAPGEVKLETGTMVKAKTSAPSGTPVTLTLRPEKLHLVATQAECLPDRCQIPGTIHRRIYYGDSLYYEVDVGIGHALDVRVENLPRARRWDEGEAVIVDFHPEAAEALVE